MTYNFDPERWYDIESRHLERQYAAGELSKDQFDAALSALQDRFEDIMDHLNSVAGFSAAPMPPAPVVKK